MHVPSLSPIAHCEAPVSLCSLLLEGFATTVQSTASLGWSDSLAAVTLVPSTEFEAMFQEDAESGVRMKWEGKEKGTIC